MKVGDTFYRVNLGPGEPYKCHVVAIVDEEQIVYKWFGRRKQWWHYCVDHVSLIQTFIEMHNAEMGGSSPSEDSPDCIVMPPKMDTSYKDFSDAVALSLFSYPKLFNAPEHRQSEAESGDSVGCKGGAE